MTDRIIRIRIDARDATRGINQVEGQMQRLQGTTNQLQTQLTRVAQAIAAAFSVSTIVAYADAYTNIQNRLRVVTSSTEQLTRVTAELLQVANATRAEFESTATLFSTLARSTEELGISEERLIAITRTINQTFAVAGASAQEASNAIRQLSQGLASGALRGDEFNSVAEQAPGILRAVAAETGKTIGQLREFAATGGITAKLLIRAIENYGSTVEREFGKTNRTFEQSAVTARNNAVAYIGASEALNNATRAAGEALVVLSENLDVLGDAFILISAVIAGKYITSIGSAIAADIAKRASTVELLRSEQALAVEANRRAIQEQAAAQRALANASSDRLRAVAITNLARANQVATASQVTLNSATAAYAGVASAAGIAVRGASAAFALLGGPLGVVLLAASAIAIFSSRAREAAEEASDLRLGKEISELVNKFKGLNEEGKKITFKKLTDEQLALSSSLRQVNERIVELEDAQAKSDRPQAFAVALSSARKRAQELSGALNDLTEKQKALFDLGLPPDSSFVNPDTIDKSTQAIGRLGDSLSGLRSVSSGIDSIFSGEFNLFGGAEDTSAQDDQTAARINERIEAIRLETQTIASEYAIQSAVRQQAFTQEEADLATQTANRIMTAISQRELLLAEDAITKEQQLAAETAFQEQLTAIDQLYNEQRLELQRQVNLEKQAIEQQTQDTYLDTASTALGALAGLVGGSSKAAKALKLVQAGVNAFQVFAASQAAAALVLATPPGPVLNPSLVPLAASIVAKGKVSAAAILAGAAAQTFSGGGGGGGIGGLSGGSTSQTLPTTPQAAQQVGAVEITGLGELVDELRAQDGMVSTQFVAKLLDKVQDANRLRGEG